MEHKPSFLYPCFLGPLAENGELLEKLVVEYLRDHVYWRRNFHPEDKPVIPPLAPYMPEVQEVVARTRQALHRLSADLKRSVPFFSPRYLGHMASDLLLPGVIAQIITTLYNPNNVSADAGGATVDMELEVGRLLARMFGFNLDEDRGACAWGHLTSGGTVANYEALWNFRAVRFYPLALQAAARSVGVDAKVSARGGASLCDLSAWELSNFHIDACVALRTEVFAQVRETLGGEGLRRFAALVEEERVESRGMLDFFLHHDLPAPKVLVPVSAHYSWSKAMKVLGLGKRNLVHVEIDDQMRLRTEHLRECVEACVASGTPILAVVGVLGTTEFGTLDPIHEMVALREEQEAKGTTFGIHVDAAWGGYLATLFRNPDGGMRTWEGIREEFRYFPSRAVFQAFEAMPRVDSVTIDPHKLGYTPYPAGAFVARNREVASFLAQSAAYVFDLVDDDARLDLRNLGRYILEGSKPGAAAAATYVTYQVLPLDHRGFGRLVAQTIHNGERFYDRVQALQDKVRDVARVTVPFSPDSNLVCLAINPRGNTKLAVMNAFSRRVFDSMRFVPYEPLQFKSFVGSYTSLRWSYLPGEQAARVLDDLGIARETFCEDPEGTEGGSDHIFLLRHTLMDPWLLGDEDFIARFLEFLAEQIRAACA